LAAWAKGKGNFPLWADGSEVQIFHYSIKSAGLRKRKFLDFFHFLNDDYHAWHNDNGVGEYFSGDVFPLNILPLHERSLGFLFFFL
jgi:hypothetical protein